MTTLESPNFTSARMLPPNLPVVMADGTMNPVWYQWFVTLLHRTGGEGRPIDIGRLSKHTADLMAASEEAAPDKTGAILERLAGLEGAIENALSYEQTSFEHQDLMICPAPLADTIFAELRDIRCLLESGQAQQVLEPTKWGSPTTYTASTPPVPKALVKLTATDGTAYTVATY